MRSPKRLIAPLLLAFSVAAIAAGPASAEGPGAKNIALGLIVARITGHSYHRALHRLVFRPLGLRATSLPRGFRMPRPFIHGYTGNFPGYTQLLAATADGRRSVTVSVNKQLSPNAGGEGLFAKLRRAEVLAVCAAMEHR